MIALIAGAGDLPGLLAERLIAAGDPPLICAMQGFPPGVPAQLPRLDFRIETLGSLLEALKARGVTRICMAGAVRRPAVDPAAVDAATRPLIGPVVAAMARGDDGTLRAIVGLIESQGFAVIGADAIAPDLLPPAGVPTRTRPPADAADLARLGEATVADMGRKDTGQACVIRAGRVAAREGPAGTDAMLSALLKPADPAADDPFFAAVDALSDLLGQAADWLSATPGGGILFKAPKPGQERRVDLPVIGPETARLAVAAGLSGIVIEAGGVLVIDLPAVVVALDAAGLFLWVREAGS